MNLRRKEVKTGVDQQNSGKTAIRMPRKSIVYMYFDLRIAATYQQLTQL